MSPEATRVRGARVIMQPAPKFEIDESRCTTPMACGKCLRACPQMVFRVETKKYERLKETNPNEPGSYKLEGWWRYACTLCLDCIRVCPVDAIKIITHDGRTYGPNDV